MPGVVDRLADLVIALPALLFAITVHEYAHGRAALWCGDPTAYMAGRLTLNPGAHLDFMGSLVFIMTAIAGYPIGWAKPVPVSVMNLRHPKRDMVLVAAAGPFSNLLIGIATILAFKVVLALPQAAQAASWMPAVHHLLEISLMTNVLLIAFNLLPIYPLDGSRIVAGLLPYPYSEQFERLSIYGPMILLLLMATQTLQVFMWPMLRVVEWVLRSVL